MSTQNLKYLKTVDRLTRQRAFQGLTTKWPKRMIEARERIIIHAIKQHGDEKLLNDSLSKRRSATTPEAVIEDFQTFEQPKHNVIRDRHYLKALEVTKKLFDPGIKLRPVHYTDLRYYPWSLSVSAEAPYNYQKATRDLLIQKQSEGLIENSRASFHNLYNEIFVDNRLLIHQIKHGHSPFWKNGKPQTYEFITLHSRSHLVGPEEDDKIRAVFGSPKLLLMAENMFIYPLQERWLNQRVQNPMLWGNEMIKGGWRRLLKQMQDKGPHKTYLSLDWSQFDKRALHEVIDDAHSIWRSYFTFENGYYPTNFYPHAKTASWKLENLWKWMCHSIKNTPILLPDGTQYKWTFNGIASGFQQTQILDSFVNCIMILTLLSRMGINIESKHFFIKVQGDDSVIAIPEPIAEMEGHQFLVRLAKLALKYFNAKLSDSKSQIQTSPNGLKVLGYTNALGMPKREEADLIGHLLYPERNYSYEALAASCVGIDWANMYSSKQIHWICKDVFDFLTQKLLIEVRLTTTDWLLRLGIDLIPDFEINRFPTTTELFDANFAIVSRDERSKERFFPTKEQSAGGFYFIPDLL